MDNLSIIVIQNLIKITVILMTTYAVLIIFDGLVQFAARVFK